MSAAEAPERPARPISGGATVVTATLADVNRDVLRTLDFPSNIYFAWM